MDVNLWGDIATWAAAGISIGGAAITVWWPWHTRKQSRLEHERIYFSGTIEQLGHVIVACEFVRPFLFVRWSNNGDGVAHDVRIDGVDCETRLVKRNEAHPSGYDWLTRESRMEPGDTLDVIVLPSEGRKGEHDIVEPEVVLSWTEEPTRLNRSKQRRDVHLPYQLPKRSPLEHQTKELARRTFQQLASDEGLTPEQLAEFLGVDARQIGLSDSR